MSYESLLNKSFWHHRSIRAVLQTEAAECGLACLCMITSYWGHRADISMLRKRFAVSLKGVTLKSLMSMARGLNLHPRPLKLDMGSLNRLRLPCILHWDMNHFVVLGAISKKTARIYDPAVGMRDLPLAECAGHFTGIALELTPTAEFQEKNELRSVSLLQLMGRTSGLGASIGQILLLGIALQVCAIASPFYIQWVVDEALVSFDRNLVVVLGVGFILLTIFQVAISFLRGWVATVMGTSIMFQWYSNAFTHLLKLPITYFEKRHTGDIVSRFGSMQSIQRGLTTQFAEAVIDGVLVLATLLMMLLYSGQLVAVSRAAVVLYLSLRLAIYKRLKDASAEQIMQAAKQQTHFLESVRGVQSIRLFSRSAERLGGWMNILVDQFNAEIRVAKLILWYQNCHNLIFGCERVIVIWLAAFAVLDSKMTVGTLFAFLSFKDQFTERTSGLVDKLLDFAMLRLHGERLADILLEEAENDGSDIEVPLSSSPPTVELRRVSFQYADSEPPVVNDVSLIIPAGQCVAITGPSGCGKTTLIKLILGLLSPSEGEILIDNVPVNKVGLCNYRRLLGTVMQDDTLFTGSVSDNISFFSTPADERRVQSCARLAAVHDEIMLMPMGYHTLIGDIGTGVSGGQKQRLLLARALYGNPKLLVLDEATSHLDIGNEESVNRSVKGFDLTRIIVAHRPDTIAMAERVLYLENGRVAHDVLQRSACVKGDESLLTEPVHCEPYRSGGVHNTR